VRLYFHPSKQACRGPRFSRKSRVGCDRSVSTRSENSGGGFAVTRQRRPLDLKGVTAVSLGRGRSSREMAKRCAFCAFCGPSEDTFGFGASFRDAPSMRGSVPARQAGHPSGFLAIGPVKHSYRCNPNSERQPALTLEGMLQFLPARCPARPFQSRKRWYCQSPPRQRTRPQQLRVPQWRCRNRRQSATA
jgi:hypothetical protein